MPSSFRKFSADRVYPIESPPLLRGVVVTDPAGQILAVEPGERHDPASVDYRPGALIPGFVNAHCHLELSHMKGMADTGTGLIEFIRQVVTRREAPADTIAGAIEAAEAEMLRNGIVAVGDISNTTDTFAVKAYGRMRYYTFVEAFDFLQADGANKAMRDWTAVYAQAPLPTGSSRALTPHAPYSVSRALFERIAAFNPPEGHTISIHNQETLDEELLFLEKKGKLPDFFAGFGMKLDDFTPSGRPSIYYAMENLNPRARTLFVHNTLTQADQIRAAQAWSEHTYWATCPNANLYIENRLPDYRQFIETDARVCIGTDSLASNWSLSVLSELQTIARYQNYVPQDMLLRWATLHGAQALGFDDTLGSLAPGKTPGLLRLEGLLPDGSIGPETRVERLI
ncbi:MAG: amidohydrolase family protein [Saprospiraceae bacterium]